MPKRVDQHEIEDISRAKFQLALPRKWVFRDKTKDYGIDGEVELFDSDKNPQGLIFWVQLKATESKEKSAILNVDFDIETLRYYKTLDIPVLLVRYSDYNNSIYVKWIHNIDLFFSKKGAKTFRIKLEEKDKWNDSTSQQITDYLTKIRQLKSGSFNFPLPLSISINEEKINDVSRGILLTQIKKELQGYSAFFIFEAEEKSIIRATLNTKELKINVSELCGCVFHSINLRKKEDFANDIVKDILLGISSGLIHLGHSGYSARIIFENNLESRLLERPELLEIFLAPILNTSFIEDILILVGKILDKEDSTKLNLIAHINLLALPDSKNNKRTEAIENFLKSRLDNAKSYNDDRCVGMSHYNLGNHYNNRNRFLNAIHHYNLARKYAPIYLNQYYFYAEIASVLFRSEKFRMASVLYSKSLDLKNNNYTMALYADSLMFTGKYKDAFISFEKYIDNTENPVDEFILKRGCLGYLLKKYNIESQIRNELKANKSACILKTKKKSIPIKEIEKALKFDMLCGLAWYNLGFIHSKNNDYINASFCFTMSALINNGDIEAWKNATLCAFNSDSTIAMLPLIIRTAYFFNKEEYLEELYLHLESQNQSESINHIIEAIGEILPKREDINTIPTVRLLNEDGKFESIDEIIKGYNNVYKK